MYRVFAVMIALAAAVAGYFFGVEHGQTRMQETSQDQQSVKRAEIMSQHLQYLTLLNLEKPSELKTLIRSRIVSEKTQLEVMLKDGRVKQVALIAQSIKSAEDALANQK